VRNRRPGGWVNLHFTWSFDPLTFSENRCPGDNERPWLMWRKGCSKCTPTNDGSDTWRRGLIACQKIKLAVAGAACNHNRALHKTEPKYPWLTVVCGLGHLERRIGIRQEDQDRCGWYSGVQICRLH